MDATESQLVEEGFEPVCETSDVGPVMPKRVEIDGRGILICRQEDDFFAVDEICPHEHKSMAYGVVHNHRIICPHHQYAFELETGECNRRRCEPAQTYELRVSDGTVYVRSG